EIALELLSDSFKSGSRQLFACIMFLDIRDFTVFAEKKEPSEIIKYQNDVFGFMIDSISKHKGIINQFLGDGFMATFGAPASSGNDCQNAVDAALDILNQLNHLCESGVIPKTKIGIGLHAGQIVTGNVGTVDRKQYSITGNTVILASRIEQLNKEYHSEILISKEVFEKLTSSSLKFKNLGKVKVKGRSEPIEIIQLV
ncbi:MAG: adenylate/guanylate cyclase domain-containing protein, partial [Flavobacteriaceae bacterium]